ncbi:MAG: hypothetical protein M3R11_03815 [Acidobacteriota bacterium]|nr:hypothetical protein [Acidobacteriota bacterium]
MSKSNLDKIKEKLIAERESLTRKLNGNDLSVDASELFKKRDVGGFGK